MAKRSIATVLVKVELLHQDDCTNDYVQDVIDVARRTAVQAVEGVGFAVTESTVTKPIRTEPRPSEIRNDA